MHMELKRPPPSSPRGETTSPLLCLPSAEKTYYGMAGHQRAVSQFYLLEASGKVFSAKKGNELHQLDSAVQIKRLTYAAQPRDILYGVGSDLKVYVWVSEPDVPLRRAAEVYENQRWTPGRGYSDRLLPSDRYGWSDETGKLERGRDDSQLPSPNWSWDSKWEIDENFGGVLLGPEGWTYAVDFPSTYYPEKSWNHYVRRRRWTRTCRYRATNRWIQLSWSDLNEVSTAFVDVSAGAFDLIQNDHSGCLSLWAVTVDGFVQFRSECCRSTAFHGHSWRNIDLPEGLEVSQISCGANDFLWAVTGAGHAIVRLGISRDRPEGTLWNLVGPPSPESLLIQVAVGSSNVWAVSKDKSVWFRQGVKNESPAGTGWIRIEGFSATCVTITRNGEVFALCADGEVYWRSGVTLEDPHGKRWKKIVLNHEAGQGDAVDYTWTWIDASAGFVDPRATTLDDGEKWKELVVDQLSERFNREMKNFGDFERTVDRVESDSMAVLKAWSTKNATWENVKFYVKFASEDPSSCTVTVDGKTVNYMVPFCDITGIWLHLDTQSEHELRITTAFLTRARSPLRFSGTKTDLDYWNSFLTEAYWSFLGVRDIGKSDRLWIVTPGMNSPTVSLGTPVDSVPSTKWLTLPGHFRTVESASGLTWALGWDRSAWVWTGSYKGWTGMEKRQQVDTHIVEVYHNQRWNVVKGFCDTLFPTDRYLWSDETGTEQRSKDSFQLPSAFWHWASEWQTDYTNRDEEGWEYAFDFPSSYHPDKSVTDCVRRRRWFRVMKVETVAPWIPGPSAKLRSLSICPGITPGAQIAVWAVTVDGNVLLRDRVTTSNPQGESWIAVRSPAPFHDISAGPFCVWAAAMDGTAYVRNGTKDKLDGLYWFQVEKPADGANIKSVAVGGETVWAVCDDKCLYFRKDFSAAFPEGTDWELAGDGVEKVSVSLSDQVYAILTLPGQSLPVMARRTGVRYDIPMGSGWEYGVFARDVCARNLPGK